MSNTEAAETSQFEGNMFLYEQPVLLNKDDHGNLGLSKMERPLDFAKDIKGVPLVVGELQSAQKYYPLVFSDFETPVLIAMVGIIEDQNLFVDETGHWERNTYVPSYLRCHPFALARRRSDEYAVVFFFEALHFQRHLAPVGTQIGVCRPQCWLVMFGLQELESGEVPGSFVRVPVFFFDINSCLYI